jgi:carbonic anhydrase/acetyltransferase-like protein (isoleucine patch superfamily)
MLLLQSSARDLHKVAVRLLSHESRDGKLRSDTGRINKSDTVRIGKDDDKDQGAVVAIFAIDDLEPDIDPTAFVHPQATVIGNVTLGPDSSVWPQAVLRGDYGSIKVGAGSNVQDGAVIHATIELSTLVGERVVIGHLAHLEGCTVEDRALIGVGSVVLHRAVIETGATVAAGAVITNDMRVPANALAVGVPATIKENRSNPELINLMAEVYVSNNLRYRGGLRRLD